MHPPRLFARSLLLALAASCGSGDPSAAPSPAGSGNRLAATSPAGPGVGPSSPAGGAVTVAAPSSPAGGAVMLAAPSRDAGGSAPAARTNAGGRAPAASSQAATPEGTPPLASYPWLAERSLAWPEPSARAHERLPPPPGFARVPLAPGSFGAWLRALPL
ncbi:MAG TPA: hypothetical protein VFS00_34210, partial [Polyangiaceae bacterium]|nr:hypothetical protein [Polyangiaceae bacterium]